MNEDTQVTLPSRANVSFGSTGVQLKDLEGAYRFSQYVAASEFAPKGMAGKPGDVLVAIQMGLEIGLTPMSALQSIAVINGRPSIYGDSALALVRASGLMAKYSQKWEGEGDSRRCVVKVSRRAEVGSEDLEEYESTFSVKDAKAANLWGKTGPWSQYSDRMLMFRARGFVLRDAFGDVLRGLRTSEEVSDMPPIDITPEVQAEDANALLKKAVSRGLPAGDKPTADELHGHTVDTKPLIEGTGTATTPTGAIAPAPEKGPETPQEAPDLSTLPDTGTPVDVFMGGKTRPGVVQEVNTKDNILKVLIDGNERCTNLPLVDDTKATGWIATGEPANDLDEQFANQQF